LQGTFASSSRVAARIDDDTDAVSSEPLQSAARTRRLRPSDPLQGAVLIERPDQPLVATRQLLRKLLRTRLTFSPDPERPGVVRFRGEGTLTPIIGMLAIQGLQGGVAPTGFEPVFHP